MTALATPQVLEPQLNPTPNNQPCPECGFLIGALAGSVEAICQNCGFKDPCCE